MFRHVATGLSFMLLVFYGPVQGVGFFLAPSAKDASGKEIECPICMDGFQPVDYNASNPRLLDNPLLDGTPVVLSNCTCTNTVFHRKCLHQARESRKSLIEEAGRGNSEAGREEADQYRCPTCITFSPELYAVNLFDTVSGSSTPSEKEAVVEDSPAESSSFRAAPAGLEEDDPELLEGIRRSLLDVLLHPAVVASSSAPAPHVPVHQHSVRSNADALRWCLDLNENAGYDCDWRVSTHPSQAELDNMSRGDWKYVYGGGHPASDYLIEHKGYSHWHGADIIWQTNTTTNKWRTLVKRRCSNVA